MDQAELLWAIGGEDLWTISREKRFFAERGTEPDRE